VSFSNCCCANTLCSWHAASNKLIFWSPLTNRFSNRVPGPNWHPEICNSKASAFIARLISFNKLLNDIRYNSLSKAPDYWYVFDDSNKLFRHWRYRRTTESARICSDNVSHNRSMQFQTLATVFDIPVLLRLKCAVWSFDITRNILITDRFHSTQLYK